MATKAELLEQAKEQGLSVNTKATKADLVSMLKDSSDNEGNPGQLDDHSDRQAEETEPTPSPETDTPVVNTPEENNANGEKTNGTTLDGSTEAVTNETSVPQNGDTSVETTADVDNPVTVAADEARTEDEVKFADESNPNQKRRDGGAPSEEFDQDGRPRTGGYSYGVSADDVSGTVPEELNKGVAPEKDENAVLEPVRNDSGENGSLNDPNANSKEWSVEDQQKLADSLSDDAAGIRVGVTTSAGNYVRVKFFYNNKPLGTYVSRDFNEADARQHLKDLMEQRGL